MTRTLLTQSPFLLLLLLQLLPSSVHGTAPPGESCEIINYGLFTSNTGEVRLDKNGPSDLPGHPVEIKLLRETTEIPMVLGRHFGFSYILNTDTPQPALDLVLRAQHPEMLDPLTGENKTTYEYAADKIANKESFFGFIFEQEYELVEGNWLFQILSDDSILCQKGFRVSPDY